MKECLAGGACCCAIFIFLCAYVRAKSWQQTNRKHKSILQFEACFFYFIYSSSVLHIKLICKVLDLQVYISIFVLLWCKYTLLSIYASKGQDSKRNAIRTKRSGWRNVHEKKSEMIKYYDIDMNELLRKWLPLEFGILNAWQNKFSVQ